MFRSFRIAALAGLSACALLAHALAYEFSPIVAVFAPSGPGAVQTFTVRNTQSETVALQINAVRRFTSADGTETHEPELDDFIITPPQLVVAPGASQTVRAQWIGEPSPERELNYRFIVTQIPIRYQREVRADTTANITLGYRYEAAVYVTPPGARPEARLVSVDPVEAGGGTMRLAVTLASVGRTRAILDNPVLRLSSGGQSVTLEGVALQELQNRNLLSGTTRTFLIDWPDGLPRGAVSAEFSTAYYIAP
ncbi:MAG: fimbria/pilus periplasmic chaperone [Glycocaulis sp.]